MTWEFGICLVAFAAIMPVLVEVIGGLVFMWLDKRKQRKEGKL